MMTGRIELACASAGLSRADVARELGMSPSAVSQKFNGVIRFTLSDVTKIAEATHVSMDYLTGRSDVAAPMEVSR